MKISSKLAMGIHIVIAIDRFAGEYKVTSEFLSGSLSVNPVMVRQILVGLKHEGITTITDRNKGIELAKRLDKISMYDIYKGVECAEKSIFGFHTNPNERCPVGANIHNLLDDRFDNLQSELESNMKKQKLSDIAGDLKQIEIGGGN
ncbi:MAG: Rrf2 family transcriptional regulator [Bacillota bacterium]